MKEKASTSITGFSSVPLARLNPMPTPNQCLARAMEKLMSQA
jgi:hypothetical protein